MNEVNSLLSRFTLSRLGKVVKVSDISLHVENTCKSGYNFKWKTNSSGQVSFR